MKNNTFIKIILTLIILSLIGIGCHRIFVNKVFDMTGKILIDEAKLKQSLSELEKIEDMPVKEQQKELEPIKKPIKKQIKDEKKPLKPTQNPTQKTKTQEITFEDKQKAVKLISSKLSAKDINYLVGLFQGGLTPEKKRQAVKLALQRYSPEEIKEIRALYHKYIKNLQ